MAAKSERRLVAEASQQIVTLPGEQALKWINQPQVGLGPGSEGEDLQKTSGARCMSRAATGGLDRADQSNAPPGGRRLQSARPLRRFGDRSDRAAKALRRRKIRTVLHLTGGFSALQPAGAAESQV